MLENGNLAHRAHPLSGASDSSIKLLPPASRLSLRLKEKELLGLGHVAGMALDGPINRVVQGPADRLAARLGPDEWLILGPQDDTGATAAEISETLQGRTHSLVDISHRNVAFAVDEPDAAEILNAGCPLDLHPSAFPVGSGTRTLLGKSEIVLLRLGRERFRVECWRSFAEYVDAFLAEAAAGVRLMSRSNLPSLDRRQSP